MVRVLFGLWLSGATAAPVAPQAAAPPQLWFQAEQTRRTAFEVFAKARVAYGEGRYMAAARLFQRAHKLDPHPDTLFNLGLALQHAGRDIQAWRVFHRLSQHHPGAEARKLASKVLRELSGELAIVRVKAFRADELCLNGRALERGQSPGRYVRAVRPGAQSLLHDGVETPLVVGAGEVRFIDLDRVDADTSQASDTWTSLGLGVGLGAGALGTGLAIGALARESDDRARRALAGTAISSLSVALAATTFAMVIQRRTATARAQADQADLNQPTCNASKSARNRKVSPAPAIDAAEDSE